MTIRVAINGFGRMGRLGFRAGWQNPAYEIVHINEIKADAICMAHLLEFDSVHGHWPHEIQADDEKIIVDDKVVTFSSHAEIKDINWQALNVDLVIDCTGKFKTPELLQAYFQHGIKKVLVSAPVPEPAINIVYGINHDRYDASIHHIITAAS